MSENSHSGDTRGSRLETADLHALRHRLVISPTPGTDTELVDQLDALERLKAAACAAQARLADALVELRPVSRADTIPASATREVALARRESPHTGTVKVRLARALLRDLPETYAALCQGDLNERRAQIIADETRHLSHGSRREADRQIAGRLDGLGDKRLAQAIRRIALRLDEAGASKRAERALTDRHLTTRSLGNGTTRVTAIVSDVLGATIARSLEKAADKIVRTRADADEDERTRAQVIVDIAGQRLAGSDATGDSAVPVAVNLVVSAETLLGHGNEPGQLTGHGPIPASIARRLVAASDPIRSTLRRLFAMPDDGTLVTMESRARCFPAALRDLITLRDDTCRTPFCNSAIRHADHVQAASRGGHTSVENGQGTCAWCNYTKEHPGWTHASSGAEFDPHEVTITTPTGHRHRSRAPDPVIVHRTETMEIYLGRVAAA